MSRKQKIKIKPSDLEAVQQFREALIAVEDLPAQDRWSMALGLLPDSFLYDAVRAKDRPGMEMMNLYGSLGVAALEEMLGMEPAEVDTQMLMLAVVGITESFFAELEKRNQRFCREVIHMSNPFLFDPQNPVQYIPKEQETFDLEAMIEYYRERSRSADKPASEASSR